MNHLLPGKTDSLNTFLHLRLHNIGIGKREFKSHSGHSIKRGSVQLYQALGVKDVQIIKNITDGTGKRIKELLRVIK